jgi:dipeptidyl aminopeptidase/acylaminoacyl peptidase
MKDMDVPYEQSLMMSKEFSRRRIEHKFLSIRNGGHGFDRDMTAAIVVEAFEKVIAFLRKHTC